MAWRSGTNTYVNIGSYIQTKQNDVMIKHLVLFQVNTANFGFVIVGN